MMGPHEFPLKMMVEFPVELAFWFSHETSTFPTCCCHEEFVGSFAPVAPVLSRPEGQPMSTPTDQAADVSCRTSSSLLVSRCESAAYIRLMRCHVLNIYEYTQRLPQKGLSHVNRKLVIPY